MINNKMNMGQLVNGLYEMVASEKHNYTMDVCESIINVVVKFYANNPEYYPEDAARSFKHFLATGVLQF